MKTKILCISLLIASFQASSQSIQNHDVQEGRYFEDHKQKVLLKMNQHLSMMQGNITCVQNSTNHDALKQCMQAAKAAHESMRNEQK